MSNLEKLVLTATAFATLSGAAPAMGADVQSSAPAPAPAAAVASIDEPAQEASNPFHLSVSMTPPSPGTLRGMPSHSGLSGLLDGSHGLSAYSHNGSGLFASGLQDRHAAPGSIYQVAAESNGANAAAGVRAAAPAAIVGMPRLPNGVFYMGTQNYWPTLGPDNRFIHQTLGPNAPDWDAQMKFRTQFRAVFFTRWDYKTFKPADQVTLGFALTPFPGHLRTSSAIGNIDWYSRNYQFSLGGETKISNNPAIYLGGEVLATYIVSNTRVNMGGGAFTSNTHYRNWGVGVEPYVAIPFKLSVGGMNMHFRAKAGYVIQPMGGEYHGMIGGAPGSGHASTNFSGFEFTIEQALFKF